MPVAKTLSEPWYSTPNIHLCTIKDFINLSKSLNITITEAYRNTKNNIKVIKNQNSYLNNLLSNEGILILSKD